MAVSRQSPRFVPSGRTEASQYSKPPSRIGTPRHLSDEWQPAASGGDRLEAHSAAQHWLRLGSYLSLHSADGMALALHQVASDPQHRGAAQAQAVAQAWQSRGQDLEAFTTQQEQALQAIAQRVHETGIPPRDVFDHQDFAWVAPRK